MCDIKVSMAIEEWLLNQNSSNTKRAYKTSIVKFLKFSKCSTLLELSTYTQDYIDSLEDRMSSNLHYAALCSFLKFCYKKRWLDLPLHEFLFYTKKSSSFEATVISEEKIEEMISITCSRRNKIIIKFLYITGLRVSELSNLIWDNISINEDNYEIKVLGKGKKRRTLKIERKKIQDDLIFLKQQQNNYLFVSRNGLPISTSQIWRIVKSAGISVGIEGISPHSFRHSHATNSFANGASIVTIRDSLGHSNIASTDYYLHSNEVSANFIYQ